jgi:hypothetical protein
MGWLRVVARGGKKNKKLEFHVNSFQTVTVLVYGFQLKQAQRLILSGKSFQIAVILEDRTGRSHVNKRRRLSAGEKYGVIEEARGLRCPHRVQRCR